LRDLSLHILDLIENAIRAGASIVSITVAEYPSKDAMEIIVEDNGPGLSVPFHIATDPFYTTKRGSRTGLGLSLFRDRAEQSGGKLTLEISMLGGLAVKAAMKLSHVDRCPLGDLAATFSSVVCTNPDLDLRCRVCFEERQCDVWVSEVAKEVSPAERSGLTVARNVYQRISEGLKALEVVE